MSGRMFQRASLKALVQSSDTSIFTCLRATFVVPLFVDQSVAESVDSVSGMQRRDSILSSSTNL